MTDTTYTTAIAAYVDGATDAERAEGMRWYADAAAAIAAIADATAQSPEAAAAIVAALSPRNRWSRNLLDAHRVAAGDEAHRPCTFGANVRKARAIAAGADWSAVLSGRKVSAFVANMTGDGDAVTVDVWAVRAATDGARDTVRSDRDYRDIADAYRAVAAARGLRPCDAQAIAWVVARNRRLGQKGGAS